MINTPSGAPPSLPRAVLGLDDALVQIAQDQFRFNLQPPAHITASFEEAMLFTRNRVKPILSMLIEAGVAYRWTGVIAELAYPATVQEYKTSLDAVRPVFERLVRLDWTGKDLASFQLRVGYQSDDFFRNYSISGYEERNVPLPRLEAGQSVEISMSEIPLTEAGVQIVLDVNNKPARDRKGAVEDMEPIFQQMTAAYRTLGDDLNLRELI